MAQRRRFSAPWIPKAPRGEHYDGGQVGLGLRVSPEGKRTWFVRVHLRDGRQVRRKLGEFPAMTLSQAREAAAIRFGQAKDGTLEEVRRDHPLTLA